MKQSMLVFALGLCAALAMAQESSVKSDAPAADQASDKAQPTDSAKSQQAKSDKFRPPPGFVTKKRGKFVLYCKKDTTIGTRFKTEKCYSEDQVREYLLVQEENKRNIDRMQRTCVSGTEACVHD